MGLTSQLIPTLVCLLALTGTFIHGHNFSIAIKEIIKTLNILTARNDSCMELTVTEVFSAPKNTSEKEIFCRAATVLQQLSTHNCSNRLLRGLHRNLRNMANMTCSVNEVKKSTLKDFLERLKVIMQQKYYRH
ncbi:interleukin-4 [Mustela lutreola]|uniref:Interleukin-4 n=2 Tax=Mustela putorius furo TaxID=9669 RepID=A3FBF0_MUSPF|nr:interleukin-4 precursor [Mustela putorius furo]XP_032192654.1 interleukin-4 [Mustela erminea]XP_059029451.1 interleukin-4 [Mustela lutreola]ABN12938.1 interleukin 4 [Mustela putorius furo]ABP35937.1 interleukin 4 [Mustela putorius furo]AIF30283.1 interleukin-4 [Mustela putorius furo]